MNHHVKPMTLIKETDYGTPHPEVTEATKLVTLTIDGLEITVPEGTSIMNAAMQLGIEIPKLCATDSSRRSAPAASASVKSKGVMVRPPRAPRPSPPASRSRRRMPGWLTSAAA